MLLALLSLIGHMIFDNSHKRCHRPCMGTLPLCQHPCTQTCHHPDPHPPCSFPIIKILPCGHSKRVACSMQIDQVTCDVQLSATCHDCGLTRSFACWAKDLPTTTKCFNVVEYKQIECGHIITKPCSASPG